MGRSGSCDEVESEHCVPWCGTLGEVADQAVLVLIVGLLGVTVYRRRFRSWTASALLAASSARVF